MKIVNVKTPESCYDFYVRVLLKGVWNKAVSSREIWVAARFLEGIDEKQIREEFLRIYNVGSYYVFHNILHKLRKLGFIEKKEGKNVVKEWLKIQIKKGEDDNGGSKAFILFVKEEMHSENVNGG